MPFDGPLPAFDVRADFWSLRFVEERSESYAVRKNVAMPFVASHRPRRDGHRLRRRRLRLRRHRRHVARRPARPRSSAPRTGRARPRAWRWSTRARCRARRRAASTRRRRYRDRTPDRAASGTTCCTPSRAAAGFDPRIVDWEAGVEVRTATHRLVTSAGGDVVQRYRFLMPGLSVTAHADGVTQTRSLNGYRGICQQGGVEVLARFGFDGGRPARRRGGARAARGAELPERHDGRAARARPDDPADPRVDRPSARARPHPRRRAQLRRHELRHARHVRHATATARDLLNVTFDPTRAGGARELRARRRRHAGRDACTSSATASCERPLGGAISQARAGLPGVANARADNWNRPPIDRMANLNLEPGDATFDELVGGDRARRATWRPTARGRSTTRATSSSSAASAARMIENGKLGARGQEPELPRHLGHLLAQPRARRQRATRCRCWARRTAARASRRR